MIFLLFMMGLLNVGLGYFLAVRLGYGPPSLTLAWRAITFDPRWPMAMPLGPPPPSLLGTFAAPAQAESLEESGVPQAEVKTESLDAPNSDDAPAADNVPNLSAVDASEGCEPNEKYVEGSILKLNLAIMRSGARASRIDARLRAAKGNTDAETVQECLRLLKEDCETYLAEQSEASSRFGARIGELGELSALGEQITMANLEQAAQIETTLSNLQHMDFQSDLEAANSRLLEEIHLLRVSQHRLHGNQEEAFTAIARCQNRLSEIDKRLATDPLTRVHNRIGLEMMLDDWWQDDHRTSRQMNALLLDVDNLDRINVDYGSSIGDRILYHVAQLVAGAIGKADVVGRFSGKSFLVMMFDVGPRTAVKNAELLRQSIGKIAFLHGPQSLGVTVSGGITEVEAKDTWKTVLARVQESLNEAKQARGDQIFFHTGKRATLIESPNLGATAREIVIS